MTTLVRFLFAGLLALAAPAMAQDRSHAALVAGWAEPDGVRMAGLRIDLADGWKTYWRAPGDAGIPPSFDWSGSRNVAGVDVLWPRPGAFQSFGMTTLGYQYGVTLPLRVRPEDPAEPVQLRLSMFYGICSDICVPATAELAIDIAPQDQDGREGVAAALARVPNADGVTIEACTLTGAGEEREFAARFHMDAPLDGPLLAVVEGPEGFWFEPAKVSRNAGAVEVTTRAAALDPDAWVDRSALRVTLLSDGHASDLACADAS